MTCFLCRDKPMYRETNSGGEISYEDMFQGPKPRKHRHKHHLRSSLSSEDSIEPSGQSWPVKKENRHRERPAKALECNGHLWQDTYFIGLTFCDHCRDFIWGIHKQQGYECKNCHMKIHRPCHNVVAHCRMAKSSWPVAKPAPTEKELKAKISQGQMEETEFSKKYDCGDKRALGRGAFGVVMPCVSKTTGKEYAVKIIDIRRFRMNPKSLDVLNREIKLIMAVKHPGIVKAVDYYDDNNRIELVMELCHLDLANHLGCQPSLCLPETEAKYLFWQVLVAIQYLHRLRIIHRDLKPENVLLKKVENHRFPLQTKIADFGLAKSLDNSEYTDTFAGTPSFMAPEIARKGPQGHQYGKIVDMWSLGGILYVMLGGKAPFNENTPVDCQKVSFTDPPWAHVSADAKDLIKHLLVVNPRRRFNADDTITHHWVQDPDLQYYFPTLPLDESSILEEEQEPIMPPVQESIKTPALNDLPTYENVTVNWEKL